MFIYARKSVQEGCLMAAKSKNPRPHEAKALLKAGVTRAHEQGCALVLTYDVRDLEAMRQGDRERKRAKRRR